MKVKGFNPLIYKVSFSGVFNPLIYKISFSDVTKVLILTYLSNFTDKEVQMGEKLKV